MIGAMMFTMQIRFYLKEEIKMERWELESTHAYRIYHGANRSRGTETEEQRDERLVTAHNLIFRKYGGIDYGNRNKGNR